MPKRAVERLLKSPVDTPGRVTATGNNASRTLRPPRPLRQDHERSGLRFPAYIANRAPRRDGPQQPDHSLDRAIRSMAMTHDAVTTIR